MFHIFMLFGTLIPIGVQIAREDFRYDFVNFAAFDFFTPFLHLFAAILIVDAVYALTWRNTMAFKGHGHAIAGPLTVIVSLRALALFWVFALGYAGLAAFRPGLPFFYTVRLVQYFDYSMPPLEFAFATFFIRIFVVLGTIFSYLGFRHAPRQFDRVAYALMAVLGLGLSVFFLNPIASPRMVLFGLLLFAFMLFGGMKKRRGRWTFLLAFFFGFYVLFPILGTATRSDIIVFNFSFDDLADYMKHGDLDNSIIYVIGYGPIQDAGFAYGNNILSAIFSFVPRSIWPTKSMGLGSEIIVQYGNYFTNVSSPYFLEWYADFGFAGIAAGAAILGWLIAFSNAKSVRSTRLTFAWMFNAALFASMAILLRGSTISAAIMLYSFAIAFAHILLLVRGKRDAMRTGTTARSRPVRP